MDEAMFNDFYCEHKGKPFYETLKKFSLSGPMIYCIWSGENAVERVRRLNGDTDPVKAALGTIRYDYGNREPGKMHENAVHGSATYKDAEREIKIIFS
jgi:nucleoside-diphosphate kinase